MNDYILDYIILDKKKKKFISLKGDLSSVI